MAADQLMEGLQRGDFDMPRGPSSAEIDARKWAAQEARIWFDRAGASPEEIEYQAERLLHFAVHGTFPRDVGPFADAATPDEAPR